MRRSLTHDMALMWQVVSIGNTGALLPVNTLEEGRFGYVTPPGDDPVILLNGDRVMDVFITYDLEKEKHGRKLD